MSAQELGADFIRLGLSINQHFPGYVDAYFGPDTIAQSVRDEGKVPLTALEALADQLARSVAGDASLGSPRREYLLGEIAAVRTTLGVLQGVVPGIHDEVRLLYGVTPTWIDEVAFANAHHALDSILPGTGSISGRVQAFRERMRVPVQGAIPAITRLAADLRRRSRARFPLPRNEACEFVFVHDKPWLAYNDYTGAGASRIEFNGDRPIYLHQLPDLIAHEAYPGHHTEHAIKEEKLYRAEGWLEQSILLSNTPSALVSEGIAMNALAAITEPEQVVEIYRDLLGAVGRPPEEASLVSEVVLAARPLENVSGNQILLLHGEKAPDEAVIAYGVRYGMTTEDEQQQILQFYKDPLWRSYGFNYTIGRRLVERFLSASADRVKAFTALLTEPMTPQQIGSALTE